MRVGIGYDIHVLKSGRKLFLGGVELPFHKGLLGHSDADVILHAIADSVLGAAGLRDIGYYFSDKDPKYKGISSLVLVRQAVKLAGNKGFKVNNADCVLIAEKPKIAPYVEKMRKNIASALGIGIGCVGVKATTNEGSGDIGKGRAMACYAVCSLEAKKKR